MKLFNSGLPSISYMFRRILMRTEKASEEYHIPKIELFFDYIINAIIYGCSPKDYFLYKFFLLNRRGKKRFVTDIQEDKYELSRTNPDFLPYILNKEKTNMKFSEFVKRDWCGQEYHNTKDDYSIFTRKHDKCIVKPLDRSGGHGIKIVSSNNIDGQDLYNYCMKNKLMAEELIEQHDEISKMYSKSVNTLRIVTNNGQCIGASFRMGTGGSVVDNASSGGIYAEVDVENGIVISQGHTHEGRYYLRHPDSGVIIPGFQIPLWQECLEMVSKANKLVDKTSLIGWDVAVTKHGPTLVEINSQPGLELVQSPNGHGLKEYLV